MHGHWDIPAEVKNDMAGQGGSAVNMGIAIIVPGIKIAEVLGLPKLAKVRKEAARASRAEWERAEVDSVAKGNLPMVNPRPWKPLDDE